MSLIIDGYNLLHAIGIAPSERGGPRALERARRELLDFLAASIVPAEVSKTIVVFDAAHAPPGLPSTIRHRGLLVRFAVEQASADDLIEQLVRQETAPRQLTVVSSDHRVQQAARRRRATAVDSEPWYESLVRDLHQRQRQEKRKVRRETSGEPPRQVGPAGEAEVEFWLHEFQTSDDEPAETGNLFPPGYAEDEDLDGEG